jgi:hypothetical protein
MEALRAHAEVGDGRSNGLNDRNDSTRKIMG